MFQLKAAEFMKDGVKGEIHKTWACKVVDVHAKGT